MDQNDSLYALFSKATHLPYVECDEESYIDQSYVFTKQKEAEEYSGVIQKNGYALDIVNIPRAHFKEFFTQLNMIGADTLCVIDGGAPMPVDLEDLEPETAMKKSPDESIPESNPNLNLTAAYFLQELRQPKAERPEEELQNLVKLEEEMAVNLIRSKFIIVFDTTDAQEDFHPGMSTEGIGIPLLQKGEDEFFQPVFTDYTEACKLGIGKGRRMGMLAVSFEKLPEFLSKKAKSFAINPAGFNLQLGKEQIEQMIQKYKE